MGCLCPKKKSYINAKLLSEDPAPIGTSEDIEANITKNEDLNQKRKLVEYLLNKELKIFKQFISQIKNFNDEQFKALFEGNTNYKNFNISNANFITLVKKFETHNCLLDNFYENEEHYEYVFKIWYKNLVLQSLNNKSEEERIKFFNENNINYIDWPENVKEKIQVIINNFSEYDLAGMMKYYIQDYGNIDDLIQKSEDCKTMVEKNIETSNCKRILNKNLDIMTTKLINEQIPDFLKNLPNCIKGIKREINEEQIKRSIEKINESGLSNGKKDRLIEKVKNLYKEEKKNEKKNSEGKFNVNKELEELKELGIKINNGKVNEVSFVEKVGIGLANKNVGNAYLAFSLLNLNYSIIHLNNTLEYETSKYKCHLEEFENIRKSFNKHKEEVKLITDDIDESANMMKELRKKFEEDRKRINELIKNINNDLEGIKTEQDKNYGSLIVSIVGALGGFVASAMTSGDNKGEYLSGAGKNFIAIISTAKDINETKKIIKDINSLLNQAEALQNDINKEIKNLEEKFNKLKEAYKPKYYS